MDEDGTDNTVTNVEQLDLERVAMIEEVLDAVGNQKRLATLEHVTRGVPASDIHEEVDASRSGVNRFITDFRDADLVEQTDDGLQLTRKGAVVVETLNGLDKQFAEFERERVREIIEQSSLSREEALELLQEDS